MEGVRRVLVVVDFSEYSLPTVRAGLGLAQDTGAEAVLLNVINSRDLAGVRMAHALINRITEENYVKEQTEYRIGQMSALVEEAACNSVAPIIKVMVGDPADAILQAVQDLAADVIVIGTKGRTNLSYTLFGSVAEKVHRYSPVSVLSVRGESHAQLVCKLKE